MSRNKVQFQKASVFIRLSPNLEQKNNAENSYFHYVGQTVFVVPIAVMSNIAILTPDLCTNAITAIISLP